MSWWPELSISVARVRPIPGISRQITQKVGPEGPEAMMEDVVVMLDLAAVDVGWVPEEAGSEA
jgi:hypothetical protein